MYKNIKKISIFLLILITLLFILKYIYVFRVKGNSMNPLLSENDIVLAIKGLKPSKDSIIIFFDPTSKNNIRMIKRVEGEPGNILIKNKNRIILKNKISEIKTKDSFYIIPQKSYFVLGENYKDSKDSREGWLVPESYMVGKVVVRIFPLWKFKIF